MVLGYPGCRQNSPSINRCEPYTSRACGNYEEQYWIAFIYFKYDNPEHTLDNILASIVKQLAQESDPIPPRLLDLYEHHRERNTSPSLADIAVTLSSTLEMYEEVFLIIDALDECNEELRWGLVDKLETLRPKLHLLITSRYLESIDEELINFKKYEFKAHRADIELFIDHQIRKNMYVTL